MDDLLRVLLAVAVWTTVAGGLVLLVWWLAAGGARAIGPDDQLLVDGGVAPRAERERSTSFSVGHVFVHGLFGLLTAGLATYAVARRTDRVEGYIAVLVAIVATAVAGLLLFDTWRRGVRPAAAGRRERSEDRIPSVIVYAHGLFAALTAVVVIAAIAVG